MKSIVSLFLHDKNHWKASATDRKETIAYYNEKYPELSILGSTSP